MRSLLLLSLLLVNVLSSSIVDEYYAAVSRFSNDERSVMAANPSTLKAHFLAFKDYKNTVDEINADPGCPYKAEINKFSIMTEDERSMFGAYNTSISEGVPERVESVNEMLSSSDPPAFVNWATRGAVGPVKDQNNKKCRSAWATASVAEIEARYFLATGEFVSFSDQEILECGLIDGEKYGCRRGDMLSASRWVQKTGHLASSEALPYLGKVGSTNCHYVTRKYPNSFTKGKMNGLKQIKGDEEVLAALVQGPLSAAVKTPQSFYAYKSGIYSDVAKCSWIGGGQPVMLVGYGMKGSLPYWRIQNSWGEDWGQQGYMLMSRAIPSNCGISSYTHMSSVTCKAGGDCKPPTFDKEQEETEEDDGKAAPTCVDLSDRCDSYQHCSAIDRNPKNPMHKWLYLHCRKHCKWCDEEGEEKEDDVCRDKYHKCTEVYEVHGKKHCMSPDPAIKKWFNDNCKDTCGGCMEEQKDGECRDRPGYKMTFCQMYRRKDCNKASSRYDWMMANCQYTCGWCPDNEEWEKEEKARKERERKQKEERERKERMNCADSHRQCAMYKEFGDCEPDAKFYNFMQKQCKTTCGFCEEACADTHLECAAFEEIGDCKPGAKQYDWMKRRCKHTCGFCQEEEEEKKDGEKKEEKKEEEKEEEKEGEKDEEEEEVVDCTDKKSNCTKYKAHCKKDSKFYTWLSKNCKATCEWC